MANFDLMRRLTRPEGGRIILLVMDGLGGLPIEPGGQTALEAAETPNLDKLAVEGTTGLTIPIARGITPGSGPAHLALFGYDPLRYDIGRGILSAFGVGLHVDVGDVAARGNFCTVDENGIVTDRRAGRIPTELNARLIEKMRSIEIPGVEIVLATEKEHRFVLVLRGDGLDYSVSDTDPQVTGKPPLEARALKPEAERTAEIVNEFVSKVRQVLKDEHPANMVLLRGFATDPNLPKFDDIYKLKAACVAVYPMYKGVSRLVGMDVLETDAHDTPADEFRRVAKAFEDGYDFVFCHVKGTDSRGEDGDFEAKRRVIEDVDKALPILLELKPDVLIVTGDHSTPASYKSHSWHPVPLILWAPATHLPDRVERFGERACANGGLGHFQATDLMPLALAHADRLDKYGA